MLHQHQVYPRTCGGTCGCDDAVMDQQGLSPHVRGNHRMPARDIPVFGSIPARAGEPVSIRRHRGMTWVYPRTCGGTRLPAQLALAFGGLSPHVRGNLRTSRQVQPSTGSIPARAGEP